MQGVKAYHAHPYRRDVTDPPAIWQEGGSRLFDYGGPKDGPVILAVPSLINRAYILDLKKQRSFMRSMAKKGLRSFLLDWGDVTEIEKNMCLEDYVLGRLNNCVDELIALTGRPVALVGYCMGGVLTTAFSVLEPEKVSALALLATPWDFHAGHGTHSRIINQTHLQLETLINTLGILPVDVIQALFAAINPYGVFEKFSRFAKMGQTGTDAAKFVAMEDWLNDGVPLSGGVSKECLFNWYVKNQPGKGLWEMDGHLINPSEVSCPTVCFIPENDRIVPPESARPLGSLIPNARCYMVSAGHIGMVTGRKALTGLYNPLSKWLLSNAK